MYSLAPHTPPSHSPLTLTQTLTLHPRTHPSPHPNRYLDGGVVAFGKTMLFLKKPQTLFMLEVEGGGEGEMRQ